MKKVSLIIFVIFFILGFTGIVNAQEEASFRYDDGGKRDPFWPLVEAGGTIRTYESDFLISDLSLEGIMYSPNNKGAAIINGRVVKANSTIGQYRILEVHEISVVLIKGDERFELRLKKGE